MEYRVLFIDDEPDLLKALTYEFEKLGCRIRCAQDGVEALEFLQGKTESFDVIVSDMRMPKLDGMTLLRDLRKLGINTPFVFMSGSASPEEKKGAFALGACDFVEKPIRPRTLYSVIKKAANASQLKKNNE
jgi:CheY-like chemotaxis protein